MHCKILKQRAGKEGTSVLIQLPPGAEVPDDAELLLIDPKSHYKLGEPMDEILAGHIMAESREVSWDSASQEWIDVR